MTGTLSSTNESLGKIVEPWTCLDPIFEIHSTDNKVKYIIQPLYCQCGIWGRHSFCGKCCETTFNIYTAEKFYENPSYENAEGSIIRKFAGFAQAAFTDADNFVINFPKKASPYDKLMIIGTTLMIDYGYFEDDSSDNHNY